MRFNRGNFLSALAGLVAGAVIIGALPGLAANGDNMVLGEKNNALRATKVISKGGLHSYVGKPGRPALVLQVVGDTAPMMVNSTGKVENFNADLFDGLDSMALSCSGCNLSSSYTFSGIVRPGSDLSNANLASAKFYYSILGGSDFSGATISGANFRGSDLTGADFTDVTCTNPVTFSETDVSGAVLDGLPCASNFDSATLVGTSLVGAVLNAAYLRWTDCTNADFTNAGLTGAHFDDSDLTGATMTGATVTGVIWTGATCPDGTAADDNGGTCEGHLTP